ncbi:MAG: YihY family inner membrane protein [Gammaproteobacteria bacterium]|jgi:membrane protein
MLKKHYIFWRTVIADFTRNRCFSKAASLAYTTLLSLVPLLTVSFSVLSAFPVFKGLSAKMQGFIFQNFVSGAAETVQQHLQEFVEQTAKLPVLGLLVLVSTAVFLVFSMEQAFNEIWQVKKRRKDIPAFLIYWGVITFVPILVAIGITLSTYFFGPMFSPKVALLNFIEPYFVAYLAFTLLYIALPNCKVQLKYALIAAIPSSLLFELAKFGFTFYIAAFPTYKLIYGALATVPIFLIWLYITWLIILFGVVVNYALVKKKL